MIAAPRQQRGCWLSRSPLYVATCSCQCVFYAAALWRPRDGDSRASGSRRISSWRTSACCWRGSASPVANGSSCWNPSDRLSAAAPGQLPLSLSIDPSPASEGLEPMITNALSVDVEEYYHAAIFRRGTSAQGPEPLREPGRAERGPAARAAERAPRAGDVLRAGRGGGAPSRHGAQDRRGGPRDRAATATGTKTSTARVPREFRADIRQAKARIEDAARRPGRRLPGAELLDRPRAVLGLPDPARGGVPLRLQHVPDPPRSVRAAQRAAVPLRDLAGRAREPDGVPDRHGPAAGREPSDRRRRLLPAARRSR